MTTPVYVGSGFTRDYIVWWDSRYYKVPAKRGGWHGRRRLTEQAVRADELEPLQGIHLLLAQRSAGVPV